MAGLVGRMERMKDGMGKHNHYRDKGFRRGYVSWRAAGMVAAALRQAGDHIEQAAKKALKEGADAIVADAKARCPVYSETLVSKNGKTYRYIDKRVKPGALRDSIHAIPHAGGAAYTIAADAKVETRKGTLYYGAIVEFSPKINRPFMYPALDKNKIPIFHHVKAAVQQAIREANHGAGRK